MSKYEIQITMIVEKPEQVFFFFQQTQRTQTLKTLKFRDTNEDAL